MMDKNNDITDNSLSDNFEVFSDSRMAAQPIEVLNTSVPSDYKNGTKIRIKREGHKNDNGVKDDLSLVIKPIDAENFANNNQDNCIDTSNSDDTILYKKGLNYFTKYKFQKALESFQKALIIAPKNEEYQTMVEMTQYKMKEYEKYHTNDNSNNLVIFYDADTNTYKTEKNQNYSDIKIDSSEEYYKNGLKELKNNKFEEAKTSFEKALNIEENALFKEAYQVAESKKINVMQCSKNILLTINCLDEVKVDCLIKSRTNGKVWHDIDSFAKDFEIQPHELIDLQDKLVFPTKKKNKTIRKIEF